MRQHAQQVADQQGFHIQETLSLGIYYAKDNIRNVVLGGTFQGKPAVLKVYDDPRETDEPTALRAFLTHNTSERVIAPALYAFGIQTPHSGWLIMERLPEAGAFFRAPLDDRSRQEFLDVYQEYRTHFPTTPHRPLTETEKLPPAVLHKKRIDTWREMAHDVTTQTDSVIPHTEMEKRYKIAIAYIEKEFAHREKIWCHGHFKPQEIFKAPSGVYYLTDFAHNHLLPEGYEYGFIIWADWFMAGDWRLPFVQWKKPVDAWLSAVRPVAESFGETRFDALMIGSLSERILGTLYADIGLSDIPREEKEARTQLLFQLFDALHR